MSHRLVVEFLWETPKARLYKRANGTQIWIPKSATTHTTKHAPEGGLGGRILHEVELEEWFANKMQL